MMPEQLSRTELTSAFPWFCPHCRRKEVRRATISYQCPRVYEGQPITVVLARLSVPRCDNCGELVFDYEAEEQINQAYQDQNKTLNVANGSHQVSSLPNAATTSSPPSSTPKP